MCSSDLNRINAVHLCFPLIVNTVYHTFLGTVYFQQDDPLLIITGFCVYSVASALFMFPLMQTYFIKALEV